MDEKDQETKKGVIEGGCRKRLTEKLDGKVLKRQASKAKHVREMHGSTQAYPITEHTRSSEKALSTARLSEKK
jgi:hypothetical protein